MKINWGALAAWCGAMATIIGLSFKGVWHLGEIASEVRESRAEFKAEFKAVAGDIKAIREDTKGLHDRLDNIDRWRSKIDERLKVTDAKD